MAKVAKRGVGRPVGSAKRVSDAERIRRVLNKFGVDYPTADVKKALTSWKNGSKVAKLFRAQVADKKSKKLDVKISQVRSTLQAKAGLPTRKGKGRMTNTEKELIKVKLQLASAKAELESLSASVTPVAEVPVAEVPVAEVPVAEVPVAEVPVAAASAPVAA
jgi:hypothetical protein